MRCALARRWILRALADDLSERRGRALAGHLAECSACRAEARASGARWREIGAAASAGRGPLFWEALPARVRRWIEKRRARPDDEEL
jgi:anti-sigma factor RsiW